MLFSPGWRAPTRQRTVLAVFSLGLLLGGTLSATVIWLLSGLAEPLPAAVRTGAIIVVAALGLARELGLIEIPLPQNARQIPQDVLQRRLLPGAAQFGFELGTGVRTYVSASSPYVIAIALLLGRPGLTVTALTGAAFGLGRALSAALTLWSRDPHRDALVATRMPWIKPLTAATLLVALSLPLLG